MIACVIVVKQVGHQCEEQSRGCTRTPDGGQSLRIYLVAESAYLQTIRRVRDSRRKGVCEQGFQRVADNLERDVASTCEKFEDLVTKGCAAGWLDCSFEAGYLSSQGRANGSLHTPESKVPRCHQSWTWLRKTSVCRNISNLEHWNVPFERLAHAQTLCLRAQMLTADLAGIVQLCRHR